MIRDFDSQRDIRELNRAKLPSYWSQYFVYEEDEDLSGLTKTALIEAVDKIRRQPKPYIDSVIITSDVLKKIQAERDFKNEFQQKYPGVDEGPVLGMQLYHIMIEDRDTWTCIKTHHKGHSYPNATYSKL